MTYEEAVAYFKMRLADNHSNNKTKQKNAFEIAIECIEKQIPKPKKEPDLNNKCGTCKYYDMTDKCVIGCRCINEYMESRRKDETASYKYRTQKACKQYEKV